MEFVYEWRALLSLDTDGFDAGSVSQFASWPGSFTDIEQIENDLYLG